MLSMAADPSEVVLSADQMCDLWFALDIEGQIKRNELLRLDFPGRPAGAKYEEPAGTLNYMAHIFSVAPGGQRTLVATAHWFRRPDGSVGASGFLDPKSILDGGTWYVVPEKD
ncbi:MAG: hypothetical protein QM757_14715 [Paludibaculum sp.]